MLSVTNCLPVRFCPPGGLWSKSPVSSLSSYPANHDCPLLGLKDLTQNPLRMWHKEVVLVSRGQTDVNKLTMKLSHFKCASLDHQEVKLMRPQTG